jgi:hypothetical protein
MCLKKLALSTIGVAGAGQRDIAQPQPGCSFHGVGQFDQSDRTQPFMQIARTSARFDCSKIGTLGFGVRISSGENQRLKDSQLRLHSMAMVRAEKLR